MAVILNLEQEDAQKIVDIVISFSIIDDMLCKYIIEYNKLSNGKEFDKEVKMINDDKFNVRMKDKIDCLVKVFPNHPDLYGKTIKDLRSKLCLMRDYRNEVAHDRRFSFENGTLSLDHKSYTKDKLSLSKIHELYEKNFRSIESILKVFYSDWEYRKYFYMI